MYTVITKFHALCCPRHDGSTVGATDDWIACDDDGVGYCYLLNDGSYDIADVISGENSSEGGKHIYFDTEIACHQHAAEYYTKHNEKYPYFDEWKIAVENKAEKNDGSQVMEFE